MTRLASNRGVTCPMRCGQCCDYWRDVDSLAEAHPDRQSWQACPHDGRAGCRLPRKDRPPECTAYLCDTARLVLRGRITKEEGLGRKEHCLP